MDIENNPHIHQSDSGSILFMMEDSNCYDNQTINFDDSANNTNTLALKQQVMLNQFISITGCSYEQSRHLLASSNWQYQTALSIFFDDFSILTPSTNQVSLNKPLVQSNSSNNNSSSNLNCLNNLSVSVFLLV
jgi:hypothetical protein